MSLGGKRRLIFPIISLLIAIGFGVATVILFNDYRKTYGEYFEQAKEKGIKQTKEASKEISRFFDILKPLAQSLAADLSKKDYKPEEIEALLKEKKIDEVKGLGVAFLPNAFSKDVKLFGRVYSEREGKLTIVPLDYDFTDPKYAWFNKAIKEGEGFIEPYFDEEADTFLARYVVPISRPDESGKQKVIGVAFANQSVEHLQHIIETLFLGRNGYWFILTEKGSFLAYPQLKYKSKTIFDIAKDENNPELGRVAQKIIDGQSVIFEYHNEITNAPSWLISNPIPGTKWSIVGVFDQGELDYDSNQLRRLLTLPSLTFLMAMIFLSCFGVALFSSRSRFRWAMVSVIVSIACLVQVSWMWYAIYHYPNMPNEPDVYRVESKPKLYEYLRKNFTVTDEARYKDMTEQERLLRMVPRKEFVPTGIYLNNLQFAEASEIKLSAYFWQRFSKDLHAKIPRGFVFIQTNDANIIEESKFYDRDDQEEVVTYDVFAKINQFLTYTLYPFDTKSLRIKFWVKTSSETYYFIPDLNSYQLLNPRSLPGVDPDVYVPGWQIIASYFGYQKLPYTTNFGAYLVGPFGVYSEVDISGEPQPFFEIIVRRNLVDSLVSDLIPIVVIAVILFLILLVSGPGKDNYIAGIASVFFATIFAQIRFRSKIPQSQVVYLESLFFILYLMMLILLIICFLTQRGIKIKYVTENKNFVAKMMFWPFLLSVFAIVSLLYLW